MKVKRIALTVAVAATALAASLILTTALASARPAPEVLSLPESSPTADWTLQGRVFRGPLEDETFPLAGVTVEAYGSNDPYPPLGTFITSTTTDGNGWYALGVFEGYEYYRIVEKDPPGLVSAGATTVSGTVMGKNLIEYEYPLRDKDLTGNKFWDRSPWGKWVNGEPWNPDLVVTAETSDTIRVVDVLTALPASSLKLVEQWNPAHLDLVEHQVEPDGTLVLVEQGSLVWDVPEGEQRVFTLTKWFHVEPCTWTITTLAEDLWLGDNVIERRPVLIEKKPSLLWIDSARDPEVYPGEVATFTLSYGNDGGTEGGVWIMNRFPPEARLVWSDPQPDDVAGDGLQAWWIIGELPGGSSGDIVVGVAISETAPISSIIEIRDWIYDHTGEQKDSTVITYHVRTPPQVGWGKWVNGEKWNPDLVVTARTSDTIEVVDVVDSSQLFNLVESWDPGQLELLAYHVTAGEIVTADGMLRWVMPVSPQGEVTLTKRFHVAPCTWEMTILEELLFVDGAQEPLVRLVPVEKLPPLVAFPEGNWPWYAQEEILVHPEPPIAAHPTELCAEVVSHDPTQPHTVTLEFSVANFGIGVPFTPVDVTDVMVPPGGHAVGCVIWVPPTPDHWCIQVRIMGLPDPHLISQRNVDVDEPLIPGEPHTLEFPVGNPTGVTETIRLELIPHLLKWGMELSPDVLPDMAPNEVRPVSLTVVPPADLPPDGHVIVDVEAYARDKLIGGFRKFFRPPVILHRFPDPPYAEREITVHPYPARAGEPTEVCVELHNPTPFPQDGMVFFSWANFGIGIPFTPINGPRPVHLPPYSVIQECIHWVPPVSGHVCLQVELEMVGYPPQRSQRNIDVNEPLVPGEPHTLYFPVGNPTKETATINLEFKAHLPDWGIELSPDVLPDMRPGMTETVALTVLPPQGVPLPDDGRPIVDVEAFVAGELIGGFRKIYRPPIQLHPFPDPPYAEREITVHPYPPMAGEPTEICVELYNPTAIFQEVKVFFSWANFGIGIPFTPINGPRVVHLPPHSVVNECIHWIPPTSGHVCLQVELEMGDYPPQRSQRNIDVDEPLIPGEPHSRWIRIGNPREYTATITLGLIHHLPDWDITLIPHSLPDMPPGHVEEVLLTVRPPAGEPLPPDMDPIVDVEAYIEGELIGGFRKVFRPPIQLHPWPDPPYAEREISIHPYPPLAGEPAHVCVELRNPTPYPQTVWVQFSWAHFGIGIPFTPINGLRPVHLPPFSIVNECVNWVPPVTGHVCLQVEMFMDGYDEPQRSQRNIDVDEPLEPGVPHERWVPIGNPFNRPVSITLGLIHHLPGWTITLQPDILHMPPNHVEEVLLTVEPPANELLPPDGEPIVDVEAFVDGELIGGFRKIFRPPVPIHHPEDPVYAEKEILVHPYPPRAFEPTELAAEIRNPTDEWQTIEVVFSVAPFGIGLPFEPVSEPIIVHVPPHGMVIPGTMWIPPHEGLWCIQVEIFIPGHNEPFWSRLNLDVGEPLEPNVPHSRRFPVGNPNPPGTPPVTITLGLIPHFPDWTIILDPDVLYNMAPGEVRPVTLTVTPPNDLPEDGDPIVDVEAFVDGELLGGFRKIFRPPVSIHRPKDPVYAESEIGVDPYPVLPGQPVELSVEVFNPTDDDHYVTATFSVAPFGIGLPFSGAGIGPNNPIIIFVPAHGAARGHVVWEPPMRFFGKFCVMVELEMPGHEMVWSQRNVDVGEPLEPGRPHSMTFPVGRGAYTQPVTVTLGLIKHRDDFETDMTADSFFDVFYEVEIDSDDPVSVTLIVTPSESAELGTGEPIVDVEAFVDGDLLGGFRKFDIPPIPLHKPHEKNYAETELSIIPDPPRLGQPAQVGAEMQNNGAVTSTVLLEFGYARFGVGIPFTTTGMVPYARSLELGPMMTDTAWVTWTPTFSGSHCVMVKLIDPDGNYEDIVSQRNVWVEERPPCGQTRIFTFTLYNDSPFTVTVDLGLVTFDVPETWEVTTVPSGSVELGPFTELVVEVHVRIPCPPTRQAMFDVQDIYALQQVAGGVPTIDVEGYIDGELVGGIEIQFPSGAAEDVPPSEVAISGPTLGTANTAYTFIAAVDPISATMPIIYVWQATGKSDVMTSTVGLSHTVSFTWLTTGTKIITVTATNAADSVTATHTITISACRPVTDIVLSLVTSGTIYTDTAVEFSADILPDDASKPYNYAFGGATAVLPSSADPLVFTRTFVATGTHTVEIAVWNCAMAPTEAVTDTTQVEVEAGGPMYKIYLPLVLRNQ